MATVTVNIMSYLLNLVFLVISKGQLKNIDCKHPINFLIFFSGRSLVRLTDNSLLRLEIVITEHRQAILREISKLRLRSNILLLKDIEMKQKQILQQSTEVH